MFFFDIAELLGKSARIVTGVVDSESGRMHRSAMATVILEIPEDRHEQLKRRAEAEGLSVSELLLRESERIAPWVSQKELFERLKNLPRVDFGMSGVDLVREAREEHDREIDEWLGHR
jgi:hypothetical protein